MFVMNEATVDELNVELENINYKYNSKEIEEVVELVDNKYISGDVIRKLVRSYTPAFGSLLIDKKLLGCGMSTRYLIESQNIPMWLLLPNVESVEDKERFILENKDQFDDSFKYVCLHAESKTKRWEITTLAYYDLIISTPDQLQRYYAKSIESNSKEDVIIELQRFLFVCDEVHTMTEACLYRESFCFLKYFIDNYKEYLRFNLFTATMNDVSMLPPIQKVKIVPDNSYKAELRDLIRMKNLDQLMKKAVSTLLYENRKVVFFLNSAKRIKKFVSMIETEIIKQKVKFEAKYALIAGSKIENKTISEFPNKVVSYKDADVIIVSSAGYDSHSMYIDDADVYMSIELGNLESTNLVMWYSFEQALARNRNRENCRYFYSCNNLVALTKEHKIGIEQELREQLKRMIDHSKHTKHKYFKYVEKEIIESYIQNYFQSYTYYLNTDQFEKDQLRVNGFIFYDDISLVLNNIGKNNSTSIGEKIDHLLHNVAEERWKRIIDDISSDLRFQSKNKQIGSYSITLLSQVLCAYILYLSGVKEVKQIGNLISGLNQKSGKSLHLCLKSIYQQFVSIINNSSTEETNDFRYRVRRVADVVSEQKYKEIKEIWLDVNPFAEFYNSFDCSTGEQLIKPYALMIEQLIELNKVKINKRMKYTLFKIEPNTSNQYNKRESEQLLIVAKNKFIESKQKQIEENGEMSNKQKFDGNKVDKKEVELFIQTRVKNAINNLEKMFVMYCAKFDQFFFFETGSRQYSVLTSLNMSIIKESNMFSFLEIDFNSLYPSIVDMVLNIIDTGYNNRSHFMYEKIVKWEGCTRKIAKKKYNIMLNLAGSDRIIEKEKFFMNYYPDHLAEKLSRMTIKRGKVFSLFSKIEKKLTKDLENRLKKIISKVESDIPEYFIRRHDSILVFASDNKLKQLKEDIEKIMNNTLKVEFKISFEGNIIECSHDFFLHSEIFLRKWSKGA